MGRFMLGSTVVLLFPKDRIGFNPQWKAEKPVQLGESMGVQGG
jgi:phosphatidylserine decarboxylase